MSRLEDGTLTLEASSTLACERVTNQYADRLRVISAAEYGTVKVEISLATQQAPRMSQQRGAAARAASAGEALGAGLDPRYIREFCRQQAERTGVRRGAPHGRVGNRLQPAVSLWRRRARQTHLMHTIAWHIREQDPSRNVVYLSAEKFMYRFVQALHSVTPCPSRSSSGPSTC